MTDNPGPRAKESARVFQAFCPHPSITRREPKSPSHPANTGNPPVIMVVSSSQESEQIRDAGEGFERLMEHTSDCDDSQVGTPKSIAMDLAEDTRPMSATPKSNRISNVRRETPMHDLTWNPEDQHWLDRLEDGAYPCDDALECALKYSQITAKVIRSIINNRFLKDIAKISESTHDHADRTSHIYPQCIREGRPMKPEPTTSLVDNEDMETDHEPDWGNSKPGKGWGQVAHHPQPTNPFIDFDPTSGLVNPNPNTPSTLSTDNPILNQILKKLEQLDNINTRLSRLEGSKPQAKPAQTTQPASAPKPNQNTSNSTSVSWADVAAKGNSKAPEVKASNIASALKRDIAKPSPAQSDDRNFVVRFKTLPVTQPNPESIFVSMRECLDAANRTLGKGRLTRVRWTLKASLHLSFSNSASITAIENAIPLLMDKLKMPEYDFGPEVPWSRLVVTNVPTGMGGPAQRMRNRDELTQLLRDSFPEEAKFGDLKITLSPDWLADPARLQAEGRQASTVSFAFEDAGASPRAAYSLTHNYSYTAESTDTPNDSAAPRSPAATNAAATPTPPKTTMPTTAPDAYGRARETHANACIARHAVFTDTDSTPRMSEDVRVPPPHHADHCKPVDRHILAVDLKLHDSPLTIINCYPHGKSLKDTVDAITNINIPMDRPCIMAPREQHRPNAQERMFKAYAEYQDLHVLNHLSLPTHIVPRSPASNAIIDLTLLNSRAVDAWPNLNWEVEAQSSGKSLGSDHMAITWTIGPHDQAESVGVTEPSPRHLIDTSRQKKWTQEYMRQVQKNPLPTDPSVAEDADRMTSIILDAMSNATRLVMPSPPCQKRAGPVRSPWWTDECSEAVHNLKHNPDQKPREQLRAALRGAIRRARKSRGDKILAEISTQRVFDVLKWYQATHPHDKAKHLGLQFFPQVNSPHVTLEPLGLKSTPRRPHQPITSAEVRSALELTSNRSAPGAFGSNYRLLKWAFNASPNIFVNLFNLCLEIGYHPTALRNCIIAPIPKPNRADMSTPKNYRPIALLETLSKLLKKVVTARLLHEAGEHNLIPQAQFGGKDIMSCTDAGLCMVHDIRTAWKNNKAASLLTLDVSGYFNNVDHSRLIYTLDRLGYSTNICNWLKSYLSNRTAQFRIDGPLHQENINIISEVTKNINQVAIKLGLEFELPKSDLIHFICSPKTPHSNPSLTFSHSGTDTTISPKDVVRWLGFFLDRRLNFKEHIQTMAIKAKATLAGLRMLANSQNGLSVRHARILFKASVTPILTYGLPLWLEVDTWCLPNHSLQMHGTPRFHTPLHIACLRIIENLARKLKSIPALAEVARRLPPEWDSSTERQHNPKSPITFAASLSHPDIEFITPYLVHPSKPPVPWPGQLEIEHKSPAPSKKAAAKIIQNEIDEAESNHLGNTVHGFSDGHAGTLNGIPKVGLGYIVKYGRQILARNSHSIGPRANIYDAEMLGIAMCLNSAARIAEQVQAKRIIIYCDNQAAVKAISSLHRPRPIRIENFPSTRPTIPGKRPVPPHHDQVATRTLQNRWK
ncbi:Reverse transcriptase (RNA-dependent DNA polymerase) [Rhizoctonia solani]|uniref:Reverse transcriptase (RNA-dependent DNA polymerase) n=1 Tax=Rhizoctonia solani TaxID=456999 RepID=A0A8H7I3W9_9AGAM|nr:Reverse transcriptase (RNA-dependent DNA polymerase) [Rhizoctonia solani]